MKLVVILDVTALVDVRAASLPTVICDLTIIVNNVQTWHQVVVLVVLMAI